MTTNGAGRHGTEYHLRSSSRARRMYVLVSRAGDGWGWAYIEAGFVVHAGSGNFVGRAAALRAAADELLEELSDFAEAASLARRLRCAAAKLKSD